jgi:hypothetical protein
MNPETQSGFIVHHSSFIVSETRLLSPHGTGGETSGATTSVAPLVFLVAPKPVT